jgi:hypothetical protein
MDRITVTKRRIDILVGEGEVEYAGDLAGHRCSLGEVVTYALDHLRRTAAPKFERAGLKARFATKGAA